MIIFVILVIFVKSGEYVLILEGNCDDEENCKDIFHNFYINEIL